VQSGLRIACGGLDQAGNRQHICIIRIEGQRPSYMVPGAIWLLGVESGFAQCPMADAIHGIKSNRSFGRLHGLPPPIVEIV